MFRKNKIDTEGLNEVIYLVKNILKVLFIALIISIGLIAVILFRELGIFKFIGNVIGVLSPLFIGFIVAWLFSPLVDKLTKKGLPRIIASLIVYVIFILFLVIFFRIFIPIIYTEFNELIKTLPGILEDITDFINNIFSKIEMNNSNMENIKEGILKAVNEYGNNISSSIPTTVVNIMSSLFSGLGSVFFGLIIGLYMLFDFDNVSILFLRLIPKKHQIEIGGLLDNIGIEVRKCVNGTLLVACMVFVCDTIGFSIVGLKSALLFGLFCGITDLIPYVGPYIGGAVAVIIGFAQSPLIGFLTIVVAVVVQLIENNILQPVVMSKTMKLHPVTIIVGLLIFEHFFGIIGMILATPCIALGKVVWKFFKEKYNLFHDNDYEEIPKE